MSSSCTPFSTSLSLYFAFYFILFYWLRTSYSSNKQFSQPSLLIYCTLSLKPTCNVQGFQRRWPSKGRRLLLLSSSPPFPSRWEETCTTQICSSITSTRQNQSKRTKLQLDNKTKNAKYEVLIYSLACNKMLHGIG